MKKQIKKVAATAVAAALILTAPGLPCYRALATGIVVGVKISANAGAIGRVAAAGGGLGRLNPVQHDLGAVGKINPLGISLVGIGETPQMQAKPSVGVRPIIRKTEAAAVPTVTLEAVPRIVPAAERTVDKAAVLGHPTGAVTHLSGLAGDIGAAQSRNGAGKSIGEISTALRKFWSGLKTAGTGSLNPVAGSEGIVTRNSGLMPASIKPGAVKMRLLRKTIFDDAGVPPPLTPRVVRRYKRYVSAGILTGFALGMAVFVLGFPVVGGLSVLGLPAGVIAGVLVGDRLGRSSIEKISKGAMRITPGHGRSLVKVHIEEAGRTNERGETSVQTLIVLGTMAAAIFFSVIPYLAPEFYTAAYPLGWQSASHFGPAEIFAGTLLRSLTAIGVVTGTTALYFLNGLTGGVYSTDADKRKETAWVAAALAVIALSGVALFFFGAPAGLSLTLFQSHPVIPLAAGISALGALALTLAAARGNEMSIARWRRVFNAFIFAGGSLLAYIAGFPILASLMVASAVYNLIRAFFGHVRFLDRPEHRPAERQR